MSERLAYPGAEYASRALGQCQQCGFCTVHCPTFLLVRDERDSPRGRVRFAVQQWIDAASPSNYLALNPEAQRKALETGGESIAPSAAARSASSLPTRW